MILDLKSIFVEEGSVLHKEHLLSMADIKVDGTCPFAEPVKVDITAENRAGLVKLSLATSFNYQQPCDRCGADVTKNMHYNFEHYLVTSLSGDQNDDYIETPDHTIDVDELTVTDILLELPSKIYAVIPVRGFALYVVQILTKQLAAAAQNRQTLV